MYVPILHCFWDIARYSSKIADFSPSHLYSTPTLGVTQLEFCHNLWYEITRKNLCAMGRRCLCDVKFSRFGTVPACDRQTDRQTEGQTHDDSTYRANIASPSRGKNGSEVTNPLFIYIPCKLPERSQHSQKCKNPRRQFLCLVILTPWPQNKWVSRTHGGTFLRQVWWS